MSINLTAYPSKPRLWYTSILSWFVRWSVHYDQGWIDGWNACRAAASEDRTHKGPVLHS